MRLEASLGRALKGTGKTVDFSGDWKNELNSVVHLTQTNAVLSGTYESTVSGGGSATTGDLVGYVDGDLISFVVHWRHFQAITAWVGQLDPNASQDSLVTLWQMTKQVSAGDEWQSINAGTDTFVRA